MPPRKTSSVTIRDVARQAGVSVATVSRVLNDYAVIAPETAARVQAAITKLNFVPRAAAQHLSNNQTNTIGLLLPEIGWDNFFPPMLQGIEAGCYEAGFDLLIHSTRHPQAQSLARHPVWEHNTDGLIIFIHSLADDEIARLYQRGFPLVLLHRSPPASLPIPYVVFENKAGAQKMADHLIETHAYPRIAFLAGPEGNEDAHWRELGYRESLAAHGIPTDPDLIRLGGFDEQIAFQTVAAWVAKGPTFDAIFAADDDSAYGAIHALQKAGLRVPEDVPVVGFDDSPASRLFTPPLTTVRAPIEQAGHRAAALLGQLIRDGETELKILLPTELVVRRSCSCSG
jgi:DNA-binding LacI/PurR family transcriptional regulator